MPVMPMCIANVIDNAYVKINVNSISREPNVVETPFLFWGGHSNMPVCLKCQYGIAPPCGRKMNCRKSEPKVVETLFLFWGVIRSCQSC